MQKLKIREKIKDFLFKNQIIRVIRNFINVKFLPYLQKIFLIFLIILITIFFALKFFKPDYLDKIYIKLSNLSFRYLNLDNYDFTAIEIKGNNRVQKEKIIELVTKIKKDFEEENLKNFNSKTKSLIEKLAIEIKKNQDWINIINVSRTLPNRLNITITEYEPFAIWQENLQKYVIDRDGNKIKIENDEEFNHLIILSGNDANLHVKSLFNMLAINPEISAEIYFATWIGNRRWDIRFEDGLLVKLPSSNLHEAWQNLIKIYNLPNFTKNLISIDL